MGIERFRDIGEMPPPPRATIGTLEARIRALWSRAAGFAGPSPPRGVARFHSLEEANEARRVHTRSRIQGR